MAMKDKNCDYAKLIGKECNTLEKVLLGKNQSYGNAAFEVPFVMPRIAPFGAIMVRLSDKVKRLRYLMDSDEAIECFGETVLDTLLDLAGYAILARIAWGEDEDDQRGKN